jgi:hypothetical protein
VFECPLCLGVWVAFGLAPFVFLPWPLGEIILLPLAISGGQCALQLATDHDVSLPIVSQRNDSDFDAGDSAKEI